MYCLTMIQQIPFHSQYIFKENYSLETWGNIKHKLHEMLACINWRKYCITAKLEEAPEHGMGNRMNFVLKEENYGLKHDYFLGKTKVLKHEETSRITEWIVSWHKLKNILQIDCKTRRSTWASHGKQNHICLECVVDQGKMTISIHCFGSFWGQRRKKLNIYIVVIFVTTKPTKRLKGALALVCFQEGRNQMLE